MDGVGPLVFKKEPFFFLGVDPLFMMLTLDEDEEGEILVGDWRPCAPSESISTRVLISKLAETVSLEAFKSCTESPVSRLPVEPLCGNWANSSGRAPAEPVLLSGVVPLCDVDAVWLLVESSRANEGGNGRDEVESVPEPFFIL
jgi:hypothetical protein